MHRGVALILIAAVALVGASFGASYFFNEVAAPYAEAATIAHGSSDFDELASRFERLANEKGGVYAFEVLKRAPLPPNIDTHLLGHEVGDILYSQKGVAGIADCTQDFRNACSHTIVIGALNEYGEAALDLVRDACRKAPGGSGAYTMCYHGLGHGVFAYFGYSIPETVEFCEKTGTEEYGNREYTECVGGAVMELMGGGGHNREAWNLAREKYLTSALSPCVDGGIPKDAQPICLIYLTPHIWEVSGVNMGNPESSQFAAAYAVCDSIREEDLRNACFDGFGKEFPTLIAARDVRNLELLSESDLATVIEWCSLAPERGQAPCVVSALRSLFWGGENDPELSFRFCAQATGQLSKVCYQDLARQIAQYLDRSTRPKWCARIPEEAQSLCR